MLSGVVSLAFFYAMPAQSIFGHDLRKERWLVLNVCLIVFSFLAIVFTALRAISQFESFKNKILDEERS